MPVVSDLGVVGRVVDLSPHFSRVLLVIDYHSAVDAMVRRSRVRGTVAGRSEEKCELKYVLKNDDLKEGDVLITSGLAGAFPRGLPLGTVTRVNKTKKGIFMDVEVLPSIDFNQLEEILVLLTEQPPF
jgi:rod shape-determining protein MreC